MSTHLRVKTWKRFNNLFDCLEEVTTKKVVQLCTLRTNGKTGKKFQWFENPDPENLRSKHYWAVRWILECMYKNQLCSLRTIAKRDYSE